MGAFWGAMAALSIGVSDLFARRVMRSGSAFLAAVVVSVMAIATTVMALILFGGTPRAGDITLGAISGLAQGSALVAYYGGIARSSATVVTPLVAVLSAILPFVYVAIRGTAPSVLAVGSAAVAIAGLVLVTVGGGAVHHIRSGVLWGTASGLGYGIGFTILVEASDDAGAWPALGQRLASAGLLVALAVRRSSPILPPVDARLAAVLGGLFAGGATVTYLAGLRADPTAAVIAASMFPAASVVVGRLAYSDPVSRTQALGIAIVLAGVAGVVGG